MALYDEYTHGDALGLFLTGAQSDGGSQSDPDLSFGNYRSSSYVEQIGFFLDGFIKGIVIDRVAGGNGEGIGSLEAIDGDLRWTAPGGMPGALVAISNGQTKLLESDGSGHSKYIIVSCNTTEILEGLAAVHLISVYNDVIGSSNVNGTEQAAGENKLRCMAMKVTHATQGVRNLKVWINTLGTQQVSDIEQLDLEGAGTIETSGSFADWPATGYCQVRTSGDTFMELVYYSSRTDTVLTVPAEGRALTGSKYGGGPNDKIYPVPGIKIAKETPVSNQFTVIDNENDTPPVAGFTWNVGITESTGLDCGHLTAGEMIGIWIWLIIIEGQTASPSLVNTLKWKFDAQ